MLRTCKDCKESAHTTQDLHMFVKDPKSKWGHRNLCYACQHKRTGKRDRSGDPPYYRKSRAKRVYGITLEQYEECMASSDCCEICGTKENLCYDHCHDSMDFRGVLCRKCNVALGHLGDSLESIMKVVKYLSKDKT